MNEGDFVLIDLWAKLDRPRAVYSDLTRVGFVGKEVPAKYEEIFRIVAAGARRGHRPRVAQPSPKESRCRAGRWTRPQGT